MATTVEPEDHHPAPIVALVTTPGALGPELVGAWSEAGIPLLHDGTPLDGEGGFMANSEDILAAAQASWSAPHEFRPHWDSDPVVAAAAERQRQLVELAIEGTGPFHETGALWFDPHHSQLLDLWTTGTHPISAAVVVWEQPEVVTRALQAEGVRRHHALALWEYALVHGLRSLASQRVFVCERSRLASCSDHLAEFVRSAGVKLPDGANFGAPVSNGIPSEVEAHDLATSLRELEGAHAALPGQPLKVSEVAEELLSAHRGALRSGLEAREAWLQVNQQQQQNEALRADLARTLSGVNELTDHLLNAVGAP